jgi:hypothetical protein
MVSSIQSLIMFCKSRFVGEQYALSHKILLGKFFLSSPAVFPNSAATARGNTADHHLLFVGISFFFHQKMANWLTWQSIGIEALLEWFESFCDQIF